MKLNTKHSPMVVIMFIIGIMAEIFFAKLAGGDLVLNTMVVVATAGYFYILDDIVGLLSWK